MEENKPETFNPYKVRMGIEPRKVEYSFSKKEIKEIMRRLDEIIYELEYPIGRQTKSVR